MSVGRSVAPLDCEIKEATPVVTVGADAHKYTHTFVAVDELGRKLAEKTVATTSDGHLGAVSWAVKWPEPRWALEDFWHLTRRLDPDLLAAGEAVVRVPTRLMAAERRGGREKGKSDPIDALAVAWAALREDNLPVAQLDGEGRRLRLRWTTEMTSWPSARICRPRLRWHLTSFSRVGSSRGIADIPPEAFEEHRAMVAQLHSAGYTTAPASIVDVTNIVT